MGTVIVHADFLDAEAKPTRCPDFLVGTDLVAHKTIACTQPLRVQLRIEPASEVAAIYLLFAGEGTTDTWNSWVRSPRPPRIDAVDLHTAGTPCPCQRRDFALPITQLPPAALGIFPATVIELLPQIPLSDDKTLVVSIPQGPHQLARVMVSTTRLSLPPDTLPTPAVAITTQIPQPQLEKQGDRLAAQLLAAATEPTIAAIHRLALPFRGGALLGQVDGPVVYQSWDGGLILRQWGDDGTDRTLYRIATDWLGSPLAKSEQRLVRGYLPIAEVELVGPAGKRMTQRAFVDAEQCLRIRYTLSGLLEAQLPADEVWQCGLVSSENDKKAKAQHIERIPGHITDPTLRLKLKTGTRTIQRTDEGWQLDVVIPLADHSPLRSFEDAEQSVAEECEAYLATGTTLSLPDPQLHRLWKALLLHNRLFVQGGVMRYGLFPGVYDGGVFGVEEGWNIVALSQFGHHEEAERALAQTFFDPQFLAKEGQHHQYRNGLAITYAADVFALSGNASFVDRLWPQIAESADWIAASFRSTQQLIDGTRPVHFGLMPKHTYGGDLTTPAYSLYGSSTCWRGLRDAGRLAHVARDSRAETWLAQAAEARRNLHLAAERSYRHDGTPPYLPFRTDESTKAPSAGDYHQLFASLILETALFGWHGRFSHEITDYLEQTGRQTLQVARFDEWFGRLGVDAEYSRGTQLCALHRRDFARFYLGLLGQVALSCDPHTFVSPETAIVLFGETEWQDRLRALRQQPCRFDSDPCSAGTAVMLQYLRLLFASEERDEDDLPTGTVLIGAAMPPSYFAPGQRFSAERLPTRYGTLSLLCESTQREVVYTLAVTQPVTVELFYFDAALQHRSFKQRIEPFDPMAHPTPLIRLPRT